VGQIIETDQIDLGEIVDRNSGQVTHRPQSRRPAGLAAPCLQFLLVAHTLVHELLLGVGLGEPVRLLDLDVFVPRNPAEGHIVVAGNRKGDNLFVGPDVHEDQRVGVVAAGIGISACRCFKIAQGRSLPS
jgi:hypothetical protein